MDLKWTNAVENTVDITINAAADLKTGETLYAVGDWGQGKGKTWTRAGGVKLAKNGNAYTGTTKVGKGNAITFRLIKVDANGKTHGTRPRTASPRPTRPRRSASPGPPAR